MCCSNSIFVSASLLLTLTFVAVGISFFGPYWISNLGSATNETEHADPPYEPYLPYNKTAVEYPHRGLWAQCGHTCLWFWNDDFRLQNHLFTPLEWHVATQVLYFVAALLILVTEIAARCQQCCDDEHNSRHYAFIGVIVLVSAVLQTTAVAVFGANTANEPYNAVTDPTQYSQYVDQAFDPSSHPVSAPYLGWCFWLAVVGDMLSVLTGLLFLLAAWCGCCSKTEV